MAMNNFMKKRRLSFHPLSKNTLHVKVLKRINNWRLNTTLIENLMICPGLMKIDMSRNGTNYIHFHQNSRYVNCELNKIFFHAV